MNNTWRISIYTVLLILAARFGWRFYSEYKRTNEAASHALSAGTNEVDEASQPAKTIPTNAAPVIESTNPIAPATNLVADASTVTNQSTNVSGEVTNQV